MDSNWASENLQVIRTLMERSSLYRRALAPVMTFAGVIGTVASLAGIWQQVESAQAFVRFWVGACLVAIAGVLILIRRQALKDVEPFWSPPTRRVAQAMTPPLFIGLFVAAPFLALKLDAPIPVWWLIPVWMALYGCALCAAGSFMPRGIKLFGWSFVIAGGALFIYWAARMNVPPSAREAHLVMGTAFGLIHLLYGGYLYVTEPKRKNAV